MMNIVIKNKERLKDAAFVAGAIILVLMLRMWAIPLLFYFLVTQRKKFLLFCDIYDDSEMQKHPPKIMIYSLIKYLGVVFILTTVVTAPYGIAVILAPLLLAAFVITLHIIEYFKLWQYHGYSVPLLVCLSGAMIAVSALLAPFTRHVMWIALAFFVGAPLY
jgi:hypothetical protein